MNTQEIEETVKTVRHYFDYDAQKQILKEKYEAKMLFTAFGGLWKACPELLNILNCIPFNQEVVLIDEYGNPCKVNRDDLFAEAYKRWQEQMNGWYHEYSEMQQKR